MTEFTAPVEFPQEFNLAHYYLDARIEEGRGDRTAVVIGDDSWTYAEVQRRANRASHVLRDHGVGHDDRVLMLLYDGMPFVETWFGILKAGAVFCMVNPRVSSEEMAYLLEYTRARAVVADHRCLDRLGPALAQHSFCRTRLVVGADDSAAASSAADGWVPWEGALESASDATDNAPTQADDIAGWLFTSGTTGRPKGAVHFHRHFAFSTEVYAKRTLGLTEDDVFVSVSRLFFGYGTGTNLMFPFAVGGTAVLFEGKPTPDRLIDHIEKHGVTILTNVPAVIRQMVDSDREPDLSTVRICLSAGEALPEELYNRWKARWPDAEICDGIGSAEMFHIYISNRPGDVVPGSLGKIVEGYRARIVGADHKNVAVGELGRLWVAGDSTALCYWRRQDASRETFRGEWCVTADLFRQDEQGYFYYAGRADDMLKVRGQFISPLQMEDCLATHAAVQECAVVGVEDEDGLTVPKAFVVLRPGHEASEALASELQHFAKTQLAKNKYPHAVEYVDALPRNDRGKIQRRSLR